MDSEMPLTWTREKPTEAGWYWIETCEVESQEGKQITNVEKFELYELGAFDDYELWGWRWAGPIQMPIEPGEK